MWVGAILRRAAVPPGGVSAVGSGRLAPHGRLLACFAAGYLAIWALFGWAALAFDDGVHRVAHALPWLAAHPWLVGAATLGLAGAFQFSSLKDRCLTACRHPAAYLLRHYRRGPAAAFRLVSMRDRIVGAGGTLDVVSRPGEGTAVIGIVPDHPPAD